VLTPRVRSLTEKVLREAASRTSKAWNPRGWSDADKEKVLLVDPHSIAHYRTIAGWEHPHLAGYDEAGGITARKFVRLNSGKVLDGDWDQNLPSFDNNDIYRLLHAHYCEGMEWEEIDVYQRFLGDIEQGERRWHWSSSEEELRQAARVTEKLYESMRRYGCRPSETGDDITVSIARDGRLLYNNVGGHHRLSIAKILDLDEVPVRVLVRHKEWQELRDSLRKRRPEAEPLSPKLLNHPDLQDLL